VMGLGSRSELLQSRGLRTPARWRSAEIPHRYGSVRYCGPEGRVGLPVRLDWSSGGTVRDLRDPVQRRRVYEIVLSVGSADDVLRYIDPDALVEVWSSLVVSAAVRETWEPWIARRVR